MIDKEEKPFYSFLMGIILRMLRFESEAYAFLYSKPAPTAADVSTAAVTVSPVMFS